MVPFPLSTLYFIIYFFPRCVYLTGLQFPVYQSFCNNFCFCFFHLTQSSSIRCQQYRKLLVVFIVDVFAWVCFFVVHSILLQKLCTSPHLSKWYLTSLMWYCSTHEFENSKETWTISSSSSYHAKKLLTDFLLPIFHLDKGFMNMVMELCAFCNQYPPRSVWIVQMDRRSIFVLNNWIPWCSWYSFEMIERHLTLWVHGFHFDVIVMHYKIVFCTWFQKAPAEL